VVHRKSSAMQSVKAIVRHIRSLRLVEVRY
jgi:hypothetical protein